MPLLKDYLQKMVKMSPLQSYSIEIIEDEQETRVIGAAVSAGTIRLLADSHFDKWGKSGCRVPPTTIFWIGVPQVVAGFSRRGRRPCVQFGSIPCIPSAST